MTLEKSKKIIGAFEIYDVYPSQISVTHGPAFDLRQLEAPPPSYSRFNWNVDLATVLTNEGSDGEGPEYLFRYLVETVTELDGGVDGEPSPEEDLPEERVLGVVLASFAVEYVTKVNPEDVDELSRCIMKMARVPLDIFPYWRETLQGMTTRAKLPVPTLPRYKVPPLSAIMEQAKLQKPAKKSRGAAKRTAKKTSSSP